MDSGVDRIRVLVVDDEEDFVTALVTRLIRRGFAAQAAFSGPEALAALRRSAFDAILLDLKMPHMDGLATLRGIRQVDPHVQVVVLTGHGTVSTGIEGMQLGAADFLQKPVGIEALGTAVEAAAKRTRENRTQGGGREGGS
jgi:DNA-binding NtrC family response regulator